MNKKTKELKEEILKALEDKPETTINLLKEAHKLTDKKLKEEIEGIEWHIAESSFGRWELAWREALYKEANKRGLEFINE